MIKRKAAIKQYTDMNAGDVSSMRVVDLLYCAYLFSVVFMSTLGLSAGDDIYVACVGLGAAFAVIRFLAMDFDPRFFLIAMGLAALGVIELVVSKRFTLLLTVMLLVGAKDIDIKRVLLTFLTAKIVGLLFVVLFAATGIFEVEFYQYYKMATDTYIQRVLVNGSSTNVMHLSFLTVVFLTLYMKRGNCGIIVYLVFAVLNILCEYITGSYIGLFLGTGGLLLFYVLQHSGKIRELFVRFSTAVLPLLIAFSFGTALLYGRNGFVGVLDRIFQGRIYYNNFFLSNYTASLFGHGMLTSEGNFDNSYVFVFVAYGLIAFILLFGSMQLIVKRLKETRDWASLAFVVIYMIAALSESFYPAAAVNPSLFLLVPLLSFNGHFDM